MFFYAIANADDATDHMKKHAGTSYPLPSASDHNDIGAADIITNGAGKGVWGPVARFARPAAPTACVWGTYKFSFVCQLEKMEKDMAEHIKKAQANNFNFN